VGCGDGGVEGAVESVGAVVGGEVGGSEGDEVGAPHKIPSADAQVMPVAATEACPSPAAFVFSASGVEEPFALTNA